MNHKLGGDVAGGGAGVLVIELNLNRSPEMRVDPHEVGNLLWGAGDGRRLFEF
jgi:hypothetical protein